MGYQEKYYKYKKKYILLKKELSNQDISKDKMNILLFKAEWCGHCKNFLPTWNALTKEFESKYNFITYDYNNNEDEMRKYEINSFPTIVLEKNDIKEEYRGPRDLTTLHEFLSEY
uniref:Thioredoxin n=1 Tax=Megaviridae environmental sample TaxID=1737588 RepID=A0A5J6VMI4_9VIRU|nr:MAG: thioredoxin [Megaviridae environmental sample]